MQTAFTLEQLAQSKIAEADGILKTCVHYGFCTATCPTYVLFRDENDSPRGRIDLIRAMLEKGGPPDAKTVHHLDRCLSCLSCMTTCAVKVDYAHLIDIARDYIEENYRRPLGERMLRRLIAELLPYPRRFGLALRLARLAGPFAGILPPRLRNLIGLAVARPPAGEILAPGIYPAEGARNARVALLPSCAQQALDRNINAATIRLLRRHGCEVVLAPGVGCCGALPLHMGRSAQGKALARSNIAAWSTELARGLDAVVISVRLRHHGQGLRAFRRRRRSAAHRRACPRRNRASGPAWAEAQPCRALPRRLSRCLLAPTWTAGDEPAAPAP